MFQEASFVCIQVKGKALNLGRPVPLPVAGCSHPSECMKVKDKYASVLN
jgi:hypothetical protein